METVSRTSLSDRSIEITIDTIENIITKEFINIRFKIEHNDIILGESNSLVIQSDSTGTSPVCNVNFAVKLPVVVNDRGSIDPVVSTPVLVTVLCDSENGKASALSISETESKRKRSSKLSPASPKIMGMCNLDLMPVLLGKRTFTEKLIVETPQFSFDGNAVSWQNLPVLTITVERDEEELLLSDMKVNFLYITVESIYNPPTSFTENLDYKAGTIVYVDDEVPENIIFEGGKWTKYRDVERTKRWNTLWNVKSRGRLSKYRINCDCEGVKNGFKKEFDLEKKVWEDAARIEWNSMSRCMLQETGAHIMQKYITKYKYWPFQFMIKNLYDDKTRSKDDSAKCQLYQCYVDLTELLFPGTTSTRVLSQLYTYSPTDMIKKTGFEKDIFELNGEILKDKEKKSKAAQKQLQVTQSNNEIVSGTPMVSENGQPVFVIIEVELHQPLIASRVTTDFLNVLDTIVPEDKPRYPYSIDLVEEQYSNSIQKIVRILTESYRDFRQEWTPKKGNDTCQEQQKEFKYYTPDSDEVTSFTQYLYRTGVYLEIRSTLKAKVTTLLDQKFQVQLSTLDSIDTQNFIASVYSYLVEQMHVVINKIVEGRYTEQTTKTTDLKNLYFYADEAHELGLYDTAKRYLTLAIASNERNPEAWTKYAIFYLKIGDVDRAMECCREAINLDRRHRITLLIYAALLTEKHDYREAEIFFRAITEFYPQFVEGWTTLHLFYIRTEYYPGVDLTLRIAEKCMKDKNRETENLDEEPIAWSMIHCPKDSIYAIAATFLLKLHLCDLAGIALAQEMSLVNRSTHVLYYMAVEHYLSRRYEDALSHLREAECNYGMDYSISSLMGHCHYQNGAFEDAIRCYEFAHAAFNRPDDLHLVHVRMGLYYEDVGQYQRAKTVFLSACQTSPSSQTWLGAGIAFYELGLFKEAEMALTEANRLDNRNPRIWGYLCLLNITLQRHDEFVQCYRKMITNNLKDTKLWLMITKSMKTSGFAPSNLLTDSVENAVPEML